MEKPSKHIIDVAPLIRLPLGKMQAFSYLHEAEIPAGSLVSVPFFKRNVEGIVLGNRQDFERFGNIRLKPINKIIYEKFLTEAQLKLGNFLADYYFAPLGLALKQFVPKIMSNVKRKSSGVIKAAVKDIKFTEEQLEVANKISSGNSKFLLFGPASSGKTDVYIHSMLEIKKDDVDAQFLVLLPDIALVSQAVERYGAHFPADEMAVLHSEISKGKFFSAWEDIRSGKVRIVIGSRLAIFAPFKNLKLVIVDEEQDISHKNWDQSPRYDARTLAEKLSEIDGAKIIFGSAAPRVETFFRSQKKEVELLKLSSLPGIVSLRCEMVNMRFKKADHARKKSRRPWSFISQELAAEITFNLKWKRQIVLFHNRRGMSAFSVCANCNEVLRCPRCQRALVYQDDGSYHCQHCAHKTSLFPKCSACQSLKFKNVGFGTGAVEREIKSLFPDARVIRADASSLKKTNAKQKLFEDLTARKFDILIGTQTVAKGWDLPNVGLVGIIDADQLLQIPDFFSNERAFQLLSQAAGRTGRSGSKFRGSVVIQTYNPENFVIRSAAENNYSAFFGKELAEREMLNLPPFTTIIKLIFQDNSPERTIKTCDDAFRIISEFFRDLPEVTIVPPHAPLLSNIRGRQRMQILIKISKKYIGDSRRPIKNLFAKLGRGWIIDRDPISVT